MIPKTLLGICGFLLFTGYIITSFIDSTSVTGVSTTTVSDLRSTYTNSSSGYSSGIWNVFSFAGAMWDTVETIVLLATFQIDGVPAELSILFDLFALSLMIGIIKLIRGSVI